MNALFAEQIAMLAGATRSGGNGPLITRVSTDSRTMQRGDFFVALRGEHFDAHDYLSQIVEKGAGAVMVNRDCAFAFPRHMPVLRVDDTLRGLQTLATNYLRKLALRVVGVTGSNGKTSTKDFLAAVLSEKFEVIKTHGNLNNQIGLPLMLLRADDSHEIAVLEMGLSHPGDIAELVAMAPPHVGVLTGIGVAHLEFMKTQEAIAEEKGHLPAAVGTSGMVTMPIADRFFETIRARCVAPVVGVGLSDGEIQARDITNSADGASFTLVCGEERVHASLPVPGDHMVQNALLAVAVGRHFGLSLDDCARGLRNVSMTSGRLQIRTIGSLRVVDDSYNANPDSMVAALRTFASLPCEHRRIAVLGRMAELGAAEEAGYRRVGETVAERGVDALITVGGETMPMAEAARGAGMKLVLTANDIEQASKSLCQLAADGDLILLKGSRSAAMERLLEPLMQQRSV